MEEFFSAVGKIKDVKLIVCNKTRRFKGICYVEFKELDSVPLVSQEDVMFVICLLHIQSILKNTFLGPRTERPEAVGRARDRAAVAGREEQDRRQLRRPNVPREQRQGKEMS